MPSRRGAFLLIWRAFVGGIGGMFYPFWHGHCCLLCILRGLKLFVEGRSVTNGQSISGARRLRTVVFRSGVVGPNDIFGWGI
ncbi:MAG TPA: hypothetical protein DEF21_01455 [Thalassospira lucentensis]|uniref:Uncharacterized protein n=1 Tax=Thalassospira lucentensis TaxID=168935 RepID=A0A358HMZ0_9PROT|nr:hypothetical protein [Thalassospira lucentensis]HCW65878.1 hypothetical protein [Thalassospira lucentensis]